MFGIIFMFVQINTADKCLSEAFQYFWMHLKFLETQCHWVSKNLKSKTDFRIFNYLINLLDLKFLIKKKKPIETIYLHFETKYLNYISISPIFLKTNNKIC